MKEFSSNIF